MNRRRRIHPTTTSTRCTTSTSTHVSVLKNIAEYHHHRMNILENDEVHVPEKRHYIDFPIFQGNRPQQWQWGQQPEDTYVRVDHPIDGSKLNMLHSQGFNSRYHEDSTTRSTAAYYYTSFERCVLKEVLSSAGLIRKPRKGKMTSKKKVKKNHHNSNKRQLQQRRPLFVSLYWTNHLSNKMIRSLEDGGLQRVNHFPNSWCIGRKDRLLLCLEKAQRHTTRHSKNGHLSSKRRRDDYNFIPKTWLMPRDYDRWKKYSTVSATKNQIYIAKPVAGRQGNGIRLIKSHKDVDRNKAMIIQEYISSPYLVQGKKSDLRLYVLVSSFDPLRAYLYNNGILRCGKYVNMLAYFIVVQFDKLTN